MKARNDEPRAAFSGIGECCMAFRKNWAEKLEGKFYVK